MSYLSLNTVDRSFKSDYFYLWHDILVRVCFTEICTSLVWWIKKYLDREKIVLLVHTDHDIVIVIKRTIEQLLLVFWVLQNFLMWLPLLKKLYWYYFTRMLDPYFEIKLSFCMHKNNDEIVLHVFITIIRICI